MASSYAVPQISVVSTLKELVKAKQTNRQLKWKVEPAKPKQVGNSEPVVSTKLTITELVLMTTTRSASKKTVHFVTKPATKPTPNGTNAA